MKVHLEVEQCEGHGQCVSAAPHVFALDHDDEQVRLLMAEVPEAQRADVEQACSLCPTRAITVQS